MGAKAELGLPMDKVHVKDVAGTLAGRRGDAMVMFNCETTAEPNLSLIEQQKIVGVEWVDVDTMKNDKGEDMPGFFKGGDRAFLQGLKHP